MEEFIAIQIMVAQAQRLYPKLDLFDPDCQHTYCIFKLSCEIIFQTVQE
jgi:hypothetical protein